MIERDRREGLLGAIRILERGTPHRPSIPEIN